MSLRTAKLARTSASVVLALLSVGCSHTQTLGSDRTLRLGLTEYRLNPQTARLSAGLLTIVVHNYGRLTHNLVVSQDGRSAGSTKPIAPGQSAVLILTLTRGTYSMASTILSDQALGEYGTLTVTS